MNASHNSTGPLQFGALALAAGLIAAVSVLLTSERPQKAPPPAVAPAPSAPAAPELVKVLVAKQDILACIALDDALVEFQDRPADEIPSNAVRTVAQYKGRALRTAAVKGEVILAPRLSEKAARPDHGISSGPRIVSIPVATTGLPSRQLRPDDRVDVYATYRLKNSPDAALITRRLLKNVEVFTVDPPLQERESATEDANPMKNVSLIVTPQQAMMLALAQRHGKFSIERHPEDDQSTPAAHR